MLGPRIGGNHRLRRCVGRPLCARWPYTPSVVSLPRPPSPHCCNHWFHSIGAQSRPRRGEVASRAEGDSEPQSLTGLTATLMSSLPPCSRASGLIQLPIIARYLQESSAAPSVAALLNPLVC